MRRLLWWRALYALLLVGGLALGLLGAGVSAPVRAGVDLPAGSVGAGLVLPDVADLRHGSPGQQAPSSGRGQSPVQPVGTGVADPAASAAPTAAGIARPVDSIRDVLEIVAPRSGRAPPAAGVS